MSRTRDSTIHGITRTFHGMITITAKLTSSLTKTRFFHLRRITNTSTPTTFIASTGAILTPIRE